MSHDLYWNEQTGKHSFYSVREKAWHGLGHIAEGYETMDEVIQHAGLDYTVEKAPNTHHIPNGQAIISDRSFFTYRTDTNEVLGDQLRLDYTIVQNLKAFTFLDTIARENGISYETAGALGKGQRVFVTAKLPDYLRVGEDDLIEKYLFLTTSHDGSLGITVAYTPIRIVCNNTLTAALADCTNLISIIHSGNVDKQMKEAEKVMALSNRLSPLYEQTFNAWVEIKIDEIVMARMIELSLGSAQALGYLRAGRENEISSILRNQVTEVMAYSRLNETQQTDTTKGTLFGFYNAITGYFQNIKDYKDPESQVRSIFYHGTAQTKVQRAFQLCEEFAKHGESALLF